jgi:hypothetical protein
MKLNLTTIMVAALVAFVGYKFVWPMISAKSAAKGAATSNPAGGKTVTGPPNVVADVTKAFSDIFTAITDISQSTQKTN